MFHKNLWKKANAEISNIQYISISEIIYLQKKEMQIYKSNIIIRKRQIRWSEYITDKKRRYKTKRLSRGILTESISLNNISGSDIEKQTEKKYG